MINDNLYVKIQFKKMLMMTKDDKDDKNNNAIDSNINKDKFLGHVIDDYSKIM